MAAFQWEKCFCMCYRWGEGLEGKRLEIKHIEKQVKSLDFRGKRGK